jgi:glutamate 5-kinase
VPGVYDGAPNQPGSACITPGRNNTIELSRHPAWARRHAQQDLGSAETANLGTDVVIADGTAGGILLKLAAGEEIGTRFPAHRETSPAKRWLASAQAASSGSVTINAGAEAALLDRTGSPACCRGIEKVEGSFESGDVIHIRNAEGRVLGCGKARYGHQEAQRVLGQGGTSHSSTMTTLPCCHP